MKRRNERGFTLIEITAVLILLAAFALLVGPQVLKAVEKGRVNVARTQISSLKMILNTYKLENGGYPDHRTRSGRPLRQTVRPAGPRELGRAVLLTTPSRATRGTTPTSILCPGAITGQITTCPAMARTAPKGAPG